MKSFVGVDKCIFEETDGVLVVQQIGTHLQDLLGEEWYNPTSIENLTGVPDCAKAILYCWAFICEVGGSGLLGFVINSEVSDLYLVKTAWALREIGHEEFAKRFESGVLLAFKENSHFAASHDRSRFDHFEQCSEFSTFLDADEGTMDMAGRDFYDIAAPYARKNEQWLVHTTD